ncbi:phage tail protein [Escherichia coli]|uniref:phage tail protein n=1 Tax=Escherichia coli TaxID=562 RepID=UPI00168D5E3F|nr:phage tail protein [Escherichia coli]QOD30190.1 tail fiber protein [Escherichia coli O19:H7]
MHRIDTKTAQKDKFGAGKNGFTRGNPQTGTPATDLDDDYFDMLQEELCSVVEASGASLEKGRYDQLLTALRALLLSRNNPFGDIKSDGTVPTALKNLGLGEGSALPVGVPVPWPSATPPTGWLKCNGAPFAAENYPKLALVYPGLVLPDLRGEFIRGWDDGRGVDSGRALLSAQSDTLQNITGSFFDMTTGTNNNTFGAFTSSIVQPNLTPIATGGTYKQANYYFDASLVARTSTETRARNIAFNFIVRAA